MKATLTLNGKTVEIELTAEQAQKLGLVEKKKTGWERADKGGRYYYIDPSLAEVASAIDDRCTEDDISFNSKNYFTDESLAKKMARRFSLMLHMQRWADENNTKPISWDKPILDDKYGKVKWFLLYDLEIKKTITANTSIENLGAVYFSDEVTAAKALEIFGDEFAEVYGE